MAPISPPNIQSRANKAIRQRLTSTRKCGTGFEVVLLSCGMLAPRAALSTRPHAVRVGSQVTASIRGTRVALGAHRTSVTWPPLYDHMSPRRADQLRCRSIAYKQPTRDIIHVLTFLVGLYLREC